MADDYYINLINKYLDGTCNYVEKQEVEAWFEAYHGGDRTFYNNDAALIEKAMKRSLSSIHHTIDSCQIISQKGKVVRLPLQSRFFRIAIAASVFLLIIIGGDVRKTAEKNTYPAQQNHLATNIEQPGSNAAILTLASGRTIELRNSNNDKLSGQDHITIINLNDEQVVCQTSDTTTTAGKINYNTITVPRGGQCQLLLQDSTHIWLNAASSITYPCAFTGNQRQVQLTGEAYFQVAKNPQKPFFVNVNNAQQIEVLGTHFNVQAYADDHIIKTTLLEGSIKLFRNNKQVILNPGEVAINDPNKPLLIKQADIDEVMAWKNNLFVFNGENIKSIMKRLSRWYDVDVSFSGNMENINFIGNYSRHKTLSNLLKNIELTQKLHFKIDGRRVTVMAK